ncbi:hypothetical protein [Methylobacterium oryzae]|uniref:hypothetical protein n=1 Tax=Methylobacterium oryzae TaxID=334852 RepID=UPI003AF55402
MRITLELVRPSDIGRLLGPDAVHQGLYLAWVLKIANDETRPETAPGVQLVHRLTEAVAAGDWPIERIDSCAPPGFALGSTFWTERRPIAHLLVEAGRDPLFPVARTLERARERVARARLTIRSGRSAPAAPASPPRRGP